MRIFLLSFLLIFAFIIANGQCDAPVVESWTVTDTSEFTLNFTPPTGAETYILNVTYDYAHDTFGIPTPLQITGQIEPGINSLNFNTSSIPNNNDFLNLIHFTVRLSVTCANGAESEINKFSVSNASLSGNPTLNFGDHYFKPFTPLPDPDDNDGESDITSITLPISGFTENIEDMAVFLDFGLYYITNDTFHVELISPQGESVYLVEPFNYGFHFNLSSIFQDDSPLMESGIMALYGFYSPSEPLSTFYGLDPNGEWTLKIAADQFTRGMVFGVALIINSNPCTAILEGAVYYDLNSNSIQDNDEPIFANAVINNSLSDQELFTDSNGHFADCVLPGDGILALINTPIYHSVADLSYNVTPGESATGLDFNLIPEPDIVDLKVDIFPITVDRPGFESEYVVYYKNRGTACIDNPGISIELDDLLVITEATNPNVNFSENTANISVGELCPSDDGMFTLFAYLSDTVSLGTELESNAQILPIFSDENPMDNSAGFKSIVVGSFDPNDKAVSNETISPGFIESNQPLKYLIRFQNTGTFYAERVVVIDTLDANLDLNSFSLITASHEVNITRSGNIYTFEFDQIFLPDSTTNEPESHGFIRYEIKPLPGMADGESIENTAYIFFDFNAPIVTNTVSTVMDFALAIDEITYEAKVYPNPATSEINLEWAPAIQINSIKLFDIAGREMAVYNVRGSERLHIPVSKLNPGIYMFQFDGNAAVKPVIWMKY